MNNNHLMRYDHVPIPLALLIFSRLNKNCQPFPLIYSTTYAVKSIFHLLD